MRMDVFARAGALALVSVLAGCDKPAPSVAVPKRQPGLWEQTLTRDGKPGKLGGLKVCLDEAVDAKFGVFGRRFGQGDCQRSVTREDTGVYRFTSSCAAPGGVIITSRGVATGDFKTQFNVRSEVAIKNAPLAALDGSHVVTVSGRFRGPCPAGMHPGDVDLGSGMRINIDKLPHLAGAFVSGGP